MRERLVSLGNLNLSGWLTVAIVTAITILEGTFIMASSSEIRKLFKAYSDNPAFHAKVRDAKTPKEKHEIIRQAGHVPVTSDEMQDFGSVHFAPP